MRLYQCRKHVDGTDIARPILIRFTSLQTSSNLTLLPFRFFVVLVWAASAWNETIYFDLGSRLSSSSFHTTLLSSSSSSSSSLSSLRRSTISFNLLGSSFSSSTLFGRYSTQRHHGQFLIPRRATSCNRSPQRRPHTVRRPTSRHSRLDHPDIPRLVHPLSNEQEQWHVHTVV